jgi:hypothetical protein
MNASVLLWHRLVALGMFLFGVVIQLVSGNSHGYPQLFLGLGMMIAQCLSEYSGAYSRQRQEP